MNISEECEIHHIGYNYRLDPSEFSDYISGMPANGDDPMCTPDEGNSKQSVYGASEVVVQQRVLCDHVGNPGGFAHQPRPASAGIADVSVDNFGPEILYDPKCFRRQIRKKFT